VFNAFGLRNHHLVKLSRSNLENHAPALFFADHIPSSGILNGEIAHIHSGNDHSAHVLLAPADCMFIASFLAFFLPSSVLLPMHGHALTPIQVSK
jgi:hypothetical protein